MLIDSHAHLNFSAYDKDRDKVIKRCFENNIWLINIGTNYETSKKAVEIAEKYEKGIYVAIGLHPLNLDTGLVKMRIDSTEFSLKTHGTSDLKREHFEKEFGYQRYRRLAQSLKVVAIGEIGLDYYWKPKTTKKKELFKQKQKELFLKEMSLAQELNLPVIFHCRLAHQDLINELRIMNHGLRIKGVMHGFVGTTEQLQRYLDFGFYIGFNGIIFKKIEGINFEENIKKTPLDRILIETDCPYLTPALPFKVLAKEGLMNDRNEPICLKYIAQKIAKIKKKSYEEIVDITTKNTRKLLNI